MRQKTQPKPPIELSIDEDFSENPSGATISLASLQQNTQSFHLGRVASSSVDYTNTEQANTVNDYNDSLVVKNEASAGSKVFTPRTVMPPIKLPPKLEKRRPSQIKDFQRTQMMQDRLMAESAITSPLQHKSKVLFPTISKGGDEFVS